MARKEEILKMFDESMQDLENTLQRLKNKKEVLSNEKMLNIIQDLDYYDIKLRKYWM